VCGQPLLLDEVGDLAARRALDPDAGVQPEQRHGSSPLLSMTSRLKSTMARFKREVNREVTYVKLADQGR
jgi:hypothetical protein